MHLLLQGRYEGKAWGGGDPQEEAAAWLRTHGAVLAQDGGWGARMWGGVVTACGWVGCLAVPEGCMLGITAHSCPFIVAGHHLLTAMRGR